MQDTYKMNERIIIPMHSKKIISRFYLITLNKNPVYIGYTNRTLKQRFYEHRQSKDFGNIEPQIKLIDQLEYDFTWDLNTINNYAQEVHNHEATLIKKYHTQDSPYQKSITGGQTYANIKHFVRTNKNNPRFTNLKDSEILQMVENENKVSRYLCSFAMNMNCREYAYIKNFVTSMQSPAYDYLHSFIFNMNSKTSNYISDFVLHMKTPAEAYLIDFIHGMDSNAGNYLKNFINGMNSKPTSYLKNFVSHMNHPATIYLNNFVVRMNTPEEYYLKSFIDNMQNLKPQK